MEHAINSLIISSFFPGTAGALIEKTDFVATSAAAAATESNQDARSSNETTTQIEALLSSPLSSLALRVLEVRYYDVCVCVCFYY